MNEILQTESLVPMLKAALGENGAANEGFDVVERKACVYSSSFPSEIVTCRLSDGRVLQLFCKHTGSRALYSRGHRGGISYEATVYREILRHCELPTPLFYDTGGVDAEHAVLVLEYLDGAIRITTSRDAIGAVTKSADWIGKFHATFSDGRLPERYPFLRANDGNYFHGWAQWARRTLAQGEGRYQRLPWVAAVCDEYERLIDVLTRTESSIVHSEYYPANILILGGNIIPVDWESAAISIGEIDLALLTDGWSDEIVQECQTHYIRSRYSDGAPSDFQERFDAATIFLLFRFLGETRRAPESPSIIARIDRLYSLGQRMGLL